jgi:hypothetical protein
MRQEKRIQAAWATRVECEPSAEEPKKTSCLCARGEELKKTSCLCARRRRGQDTGATGGADRGLVARSTQDPVAKQVERHLPDAD